MAASSTAGTKTAAVLAFAVLLLCSLATGSCPPGMSAENMTVGRNLSLESVLRIIDSRNNSEKCFQVHLCRGPHVLPENLTVWGNVVLMRQPGRASERRPTVSCSMPTPEVPLQTADTQDLAALTFRGARYAGIEGVVFENCPLAIQFLEMEEVSISASLFRWVKGVPQSSYFPAEGACHIP